jgi:hypothetical protein
VLGVDASSGCSERVGVERPGGRLGNCWKASLSTICVSSVSGPVEETAAQVERLGGVEALDIDPTVLEKRFDAPRIGGTLVSLIPSVVLFSPAKKAASLSPPFVSFSIASLAALSLVLGDSSLGDIFLIAIACVELALSLPWPILPDTLGDLSFLFRCRLLDLALWLLMVLGPLNPCT